MNRDREIIDLAKLLNEIEDYDEILRIINHRLVEWFNPAAALINMINPNTKETIRTLNKEQGNKNLIGRYHYLNTLISGWVINNKAIYFSNNLKSEKLLQLIKNYPIPFDSAICAPIKSGRKIIGTVLLLNVKNNLTESDKDIMERVIAVISPFVHDYQNIQEYFIRPIESDDLQNRYSELGLIGRSKAFINLLRSIESAAKCNVRVLLEGETGTGKELIANAIHKLSSRTENKFIVLDCSSVPGHLIESEIFGHLKGSFTGAINDRKGLVEEADKGTLFIDEINLLDMDLQSKLLRLIQESKYKKLGSNEYKKVDLRIIAAASSSLIKMVQKGKFMPELYYRLNVFPILIPTLNERRNDIPLLVNYFLNKICKDQNKNIQSVSENIMLLLTCRSWEGNIRELENFIERLVTLTPEKVSIISDKMLPDINKRELRKIKNSESMDIEIKSLTESLEIYEEMLLRNALNKYKWNQSAAAESLLLKEQTLRYKMNKYGIVNSKN